MPPLPNVPGVVRVACNMTSGLGSPQVSRFFISYSGTAPTIAQLNTFATAISSAWGTDLAPLKNANGGLIRVDAIDLTSPTAAVGVHTGTVSGTRAGIEPDAAVSAVSSYKIARRYRGGHPRGYWPFGSNVDMTSATVWSSTFVTACDSGLNAFYTAIVGAGWTGAGTLLHVNVSYYHSFTVVISPLTGRARNVPTLRGTPIADSVTAVATKSSIGTQRRRLEFVD